MSTAAITDALRLACRGAVRRVSHGPAGRAQDLLLRHGWLAPVGGQPPALGLTWRGEIELRHRL